MIRLIGLHGPKQSGKDTAYQILSDKLDVTVNRDAFADRLKLSAIRCFWPEASSSDAYQMAELLKKDGSIKMTYKRLDGEENTIEVSGRLFLQQYGTEAHREIFGSDFWTHAVLPDITDRFNFGRKDPHPWSLLVITDVRFPDEAEAIRNAGGVIWQIWRPENTCEDDHISEKPLPVEHIDDVIINNGTKKDLEHNILQAWGRLHIPTTYHGV